MVRALNVKQFDFVATEDQPVVQMNANVCEKLKRAMTAAPAQTISGALHDAAILAPHVPTAMLFIASKGGISHNPAEFSRLEDIALAARILAEVVAA